MFAIEKSSHPSFHGELGVAQVRAALEGPESSYSPLAAAKSKKSSPWDAEEAWKVYSMLSDILPAVCRMLESVETGSRRGKR